MADSPFFLQSHGFQPFLNPFSASLGGVQEQQAGFQNIRLLFRMILKPSQRRHGWFLGFPQGAFFIPLSALPGPQTLQIQGVMLRPQMRVLEPDWAIATLARPPGQGNPGPQGP